MASADSSWHCIQVLDSSILLNIRGGKSVRMPVKGDAAIPVVSLSEGPYDFGSECPFVPRATLCELGADTAKTDGKRLAAVYTNSTMSLPITFRNTSSIPAFVFVDFSGFPDFCLVTQKGEAIGDSEEGPIRVAERGKEAETTGGGTLDEEADVASDASDVCSTGRDIDRGCCYKLAVEPMASISCQLSFSPSEVSVTAYLVILPFYDGF